MARNPKQTGKAAGTAASHVLRDPKATAEEKAAAAAALAQRPYHPKSPKKR